MIDHDLFAPVPKKLLDDLEAMLALVKPRLFRAQRRCILNPTFGSASALVGGADADLIRSLYRWGIPVDVGVPGSSPRTQATVRTELKK